MNTETKNKKNKSEWRTSIGLLHDPFKDSRLPRACKYVLLQLCVDILKNIHITYHEVRFVARESSQL